MSLLEDPTEELDRLSDSSTGIGVGKTREEYLRSFARPCASPQYNRPYSSPTSGFYDAINSSTSLILLNKRFRNSHLREPTLIEEFSNISENFAENESLLETNRPKFRQTSHRDDQSIHIDTLIGQNKYWHNRRCTSSCLREHSTKTNVKSKQEKRTSRRSTQRNVPLVARLQPESSLAEYQIESTFTKSFYPSARDSPEKLKPQLIDSPTKNKNKKLPLTENQQIYLLRKTRIYDTKDTKIRRTHSFTQTFADRLKIDIQCKPRFRLNDPNSLAKYANFFQPSRRITTSSFSIRSNELSKIEEKTTTLKQIRPPLIQI